MGLFRNRKTWEERQAEKLQRLRSTRIKEESRGKLRAMEETERSRITKAKKMGSGSGWGSRISKAGESLGKAGKGLEKAGKFSNAMTDSFMNMPTGTNMMGFDIPAQRMPGSGKPKAKKKKKQIVINF